MFGFAHHAVLGVLVVGLITVAGVKVLKGTHALEATTYTNGKIYSGGYTMSPNSTVPNASVRKLVLSDGGFFPRRWSSMSFDGAHVAYESLDFDTNVSAVIKGNVDYSTSTIVDNKVVRDLPANFRNYDQPPVWSPDGTTWVVAVHSSNSDTFRYQNIWIAPTNGSPGHFVPNIPLNFSSYLGWRPNSARITYSYSPSSNSRICSIDIDGEGRICHTIVVPDNVYVNSHSYLGESGLAVSPSGDKVALVAYNHTGSGDQQSSDIYTVNPDGTNLQRLTTHIAGKQVDAVVWSPDGKKIAYTMDASKSIHPIDSGVWVMNTDGTGKTQLSTSPNYNPFSLSWPHS